MAAAERLAKDKSMNKSVRKKRQKDLQAATVKLRGLEVGLSQLRLSASKPDVSSLGSNGSAGIFISSFFEETIQHPGQVWPSLEKWRNLVRRRLMAPFPTYIKTESTKSTV